MQMRKQHKEQAKKLVGSLVSHACEKRHRFFFFSLTDGNKCHNKHVCSKFKCMKVFHHRCDGSQQNDENPSDHRTDPRGSTEKEKTTKDQRECELNSLFELSHECSSVCVCVRE